LEDPYTHKHSTAHVANSKLFQGTMASRPTTSAATFTSSPKPNIQLSTSSSSWDPVIAAYDTRSPFNFQGFKPFKQGEFLVEAIRKQRIRNGRPEYLVKWSGYPESDNTWEPRNHLVNPVGVVNTVLAQWDRQMHLSE